MIYIGLSADLPKIIRKSGENNTLYGKSHCETTKVLIRQKALNRKHSCETKDKMSKTHGNPVNIYEKCYSEGFKWIGSFVSARRAAKFLGVSGSTVIRYIQSWEYLKREICFHLNKFWITMSKNSLYAGNF